MSGDKPIESCDRCIHYRGDGICMMEQNVVVMRSRTDREPRELWAQPFNRPCRYFRVKDTRGG